jgi:hypothetical protein
MKIKASGSFLSNVFYGDHVLDFLVPHRIEIDIPGQILTISKRNYYLIGVDKVSIPIRNVRRVEINRHLFGADLNIKIFGSTDVKAKCLSKKGALGVYHYLLSHKTK